MGGTKLLVFYENEPLPPTDGGRVRWRGVIFDHHPIREPQGWRFYKDRSLGSGIPGLGRLLYSPSDGWTGHDEHYGRSLAAGHDERTAVRRTAMRDWDPEAECALREYYRPYRERVS